MNLQITERVVEEKGLTSNSQRKNNPKDFEELHTYELHNVDVDQLIYQYCH
jgi:hypothetical protein